MNKKKQVEFGSEIAKILPVILREVASKQQSILMKGNLAVSHIIVLEFIKAKGACTMGELAKALNYTMSAATAIVDKMIAEGFVKRERSREDRRVVRVELLKKGESTAEEVYKSRKDAADSLFSALTEKERAEYLRLLNKVYNSIRKQS